MSQETLAERLRRWNYSQAVNDRVLPILKIAEQGDIRGFEQAICEFTRGILQELEKHELDGKAADERFMVLDLYITERDLRDNLSEEVQELVLEGLHLHHYGDAHGPDIDGMRKLIDKQLRNSGDA